MTSMSLPGGSWQLGDLTVSRFGYGAMQLAGPWVMGPPKDHDAAVHVLQEAVRLGITHIDTSDAYGPRFTNEVIREALHPYPASLHIVTKVGGSRDEQGGWPVARTADDVRGQVRTNLETLGLDKLDLVHLRMGDGQGPVAGESVADPLTALVELQQQGLIRHLGMSNATAAQVAEARSMASIVSVQNLYNLANRQDDDLVDELATVGIAYIPFFPLGGFSPLQADALTAVSGRLGVTRMSVALAWLLQRSPNILLIPGTSSAEHLRENVDGASLQLSTDDVAELDSIGR
jgi:pyridoxine 4-dehydrogenase